MKRQLSLLVTAFIAVACSPSKENTYDYTLSAGKNSVSDRSKKAFSHANTKIKDENEDLFLLGRSFFTIPWVQAPAATTARDGLGPLFNSNTCISCHPHHGSGMAVNEQGKMNRSLLMRLALKGQKNSINGLVADPHYGTQLNINGNMNVKFEGSAEVVYTKIENKYPDGNPYTLMQPTYKISNLQYGSLDETLVFSPRIGSTLIGLGDLENIPVKSILANEDIFDKNADGISGKANWIFSPESNKSELGRFTWKASASTVKYQVARAMINDMGLTNPYFPKENCSEVQVNCKNAVKGSHALDVPLLRLDAVSFYTSNLAVPKQRNFKKVQAGAKLFTQIGCVSCHVDTFITKDGNTIHPFTDLLLHDMGKGLADEVSEFLALGSEWRTSPLWGIGLRDKTSKKANYLHDARAKSLEEAILWHGGEAEKSTQNFRHLKQEQRKQLLDFLKSL